MRQEDLVLRKYCDADWRGMRPGDDNARQCERCDTSVHDLSARTRAEATEALERATERFCVRYLYDREGRVLFTDVPPRTVPARWLVRARRAAIIATAAVSPLMLEACGPPPYVPGGAGGAGGKSSSSGLTGVGGAGGASTSGGGMGGATSGTGGAGGHGGM